MTSERLTNGWMVSLDGDAFAIINGSMYEVEREGPLLKVSPGYYDDDMICLESFNSKVPDADND